MTKENEFVQWKNEQKRLLISEREEQVTLEASKKRLKRIQADIKKNNEWLMKQ